MNFTSVDHLHTLSASNGRLARGAALHIKRADLNRSACEGEKFLSLSQTHFQSLQLKKKETFEEHQRSTADRIPNLQSNSLIELKSSAERPSPALPVNLSITEMTSDDFKEKYQSFNDETSPEHTLRAMPTEVLSSDDEDDLPIDQDEEELLYKAKIILDRDRKVSVEKDSSALPTNETESKSKKKTKTEHLKKTKAHVKRRKSSKPSSSATTTNTNTNDSARVPSTPSKPTNPVVPSVVKTDEVLPVKPLITVDTSRARSNLEVVRLCLRELGWREVRRSSNRTNVNGNDRSSVPRQIHSIQTFIGIHRRFTRIFRISPRVQVE